tara:strand:- start:1177 stop:1677 length:501 start_codon:yes stop_codon:yes gene_type:complete
MDLKTQLDEYFEKNPHVLKKIVSMSPEELLSMSSEEIGKALEDTKLQELKQKEDGRSKREIVEKTRSTYAGIDRTMELAQAINLSIIGFSKAKLLQETIIRHPSWRNERSPHGLMIDCIYLVGKSEGLKISEKSIVELTRDMFDVGTQPRPNRWKKKFKSIIEELL